MIIHCSKLTTCQALDDGETIKLEFLDQSRNPISLLLSFEDAESIAMTLPRLLTRAVKAQTGKDNSRYVFALGRWLLEGVEDHQSLILTLATVDGFEVSRAGMGAAARRRRRHARLQRFAWIHREVRNELNTGACKKGRSVGRTRYAVMYNVGRHLHWTRKSVRAGREGCTGLPERLRIGR
jgi:hypothetical protein